MKKIFTTILLASSVIVLAQPSLVVMDDAKNVISNTIYDITVTVSSSTTTEFLATSLASTAKSFKCRRTIYTVDPADLTQFCWGGLCYGYTSNLSSVSKTINPGGDTIDFVGGGFHAIMNASSVVGTRVVHYQFYDIANTNDSTGVTIRYNIVAGINESLKNGNISNAFPNPATSQVSIKYDMNEYAERGKISFYDMLGKKVKEVELNDKLGVAKISVAEFNPGIYFYRFTIDDKAITTKKLVIASK